MRTLNRQNNQPVYTLAVQPSSCLSETADSNGDPVNVKLVMKTSLKLIHV